MLRIEQVTNGFIVTIERTPAGQPRRLIASSLVAVQTIVDEYFKPAPIVTGGSTGSGGRTDGGIVIVEHGGPGSTRMNP